MTSRWLDYVLADGVRIRPEELWWAATTAKVGRPMYVMAVGFDPRCLVGVERFLETYKSDTPTVVVIGLPPPQPTTDQEVVELATTNQSKFNTLTQRVDVRRIDYPVVHEAASAGPAIARSLSDPSLLEEVGLLTIDVSAIPADLYFPLIKVAIEVADDSQRQWPKDVMVVACENPGIDAMITEEGVESAIRVRGFSAQFGTDSEILGPRIWAPVLGENAEPALRAIHEWLKPDDICPVLPFPAHDPRRGDALVIDYQTVLFDAFKVRPTNFIFADERNPFDLYQTLGRLREDYVNSLKLLGATTLVVSTHSSKLLSVGALLSAVELDLPVLSAPPTDYAFAPIDLGAAMGNNRLACAWLTGQPYQ
jgi:hypothetical protein